jgi:CBS domain-containing protein
MKVRDVMTIGVVTAAPDTPLREVARLLHEHAISGIPVVGVDGAVAGVVSEGDLLAKHVARPVARRLPLDWFLGGQHDPEEMRRRAAVTAAEAMSSPAITIGPDRPLREAAATMVDRRVNRLPVIVEGKLVGIVTRADLVEAYLRQDEEIARSIREDLLRGTMWLDPDAFDVSVGEGAVRIEGTVDRRSTARIVERLIGLTDGVVALRSELRWEIDDSTFGPPTESERDPAAASVTARERPRPVHR